MTTAEHRLDRHTIGLLVLARLAEIHGLEDARRTYRGRALQLLEAKGHGLMDALALIRTHAAVVDGRAADEMQAAADYLKSLGETAEPQYGCVSPWEHERWYRDSETTRRRRAAGENVEPVLGVCPWCGLSTVGGA